MADSIPSLRRKLAEANARIAELEAAPTEAVRVRYEYIDRVEHIYVTDPALEATIRQLQEELIQCRSSLLDS